MSTDLPPPRRRSLNRGGRPTKLDVETALALVEALIHCPRLDLAARSVGISESSLHSWINNARHGDPRYVALARVIQTAQHCLYLG